MKRGGSHTQGRIENRELQIEDERDEMVHGFDYGLKAPNLDILCLPHYPPKLQRVFRQEPNHMH